MTKHRTDFQKLEALGHIKTMPEPEAEMVVEEPKVGVIDSPEDFRMAVATAQMEGVDHLIVTKRVFDYLLRGNKSESLTYGDPAVRIFLEGTKEEIERKEKMTAEQVHELGAKRGGV